MRKFSALLAAPVLVVFLAVTVFVACEGDGDTCDAAVVHDAIASSDAVADDMTFEITYLKCAEGYGWAQILADYGDGATVFFEGSGGDVALLDLGTSVCPTAVGMPASIATRLAPPGSAWLEECGV